MLFLGDFGTELAVVLTCRTPSGMKALPLHSATITYKLRSPTGVVTTYLGTVVDPAKGSVVLRMPEGVASSVGVWQWQVVVETSTAGTPTARWHTQIQSFEVADPLTVLL